MDLMPKNNKGFAPIGLLIIVLLLAGFLYANKIVPNSGLRVKGSFWGYEEPAFILNYGTPVNKIMVIKINDNLYTIENISHQPEILGHERCPLEYNKETGEILSLGCSRTEKQLSPRQQVEYWIDKEGVFQIYTIENNTQEGWAIGKSGKGTFSESEIQMWEKILLGKKI